MMIIILNGKEEHKEIKIENLNQDETLKSLSLNPNGLNRAEVWLNAMKIRDSSEKAEFILKSLSIENKHNNGELELTDVSVEMKNNTKTLNIKNDTEMDLVIDIHKNAETFDVKTEYTFRYLQIFTAICDAFSHGANDVANAIGPFVTIYTIYNFY